MDTLLRTVFFKVKLLGADYLIPGGGGKIVQQIMENKFVHEMIEENVCSMDCNEEKWLQNFLARFARLLLYTTICLGL